MFIKYTILSILILAFSNFNIVSGQYKEKGNEKTNEIEVERLVRYMTRQRRIELLNDLRIKKEYSLTEKKELQLAYAINNPTKINFYFLILCNKLY